MLFNVTSTIVEGILPVLRLPLLTLAFRLATIPRDVLELHMLTVLAI